MDECCVEFAATLTGLTENVCQEREGWVVPPRSPEAIKAILLKILSNPDQLSAMGAQARARAERDFNLTHFIESTMAVYQTSRTA